MKMTRKMVCAAAALALLLSGCAAATSGSPPRDEVRVTIEPSAAASVSQARAWQEDGQVVISGKVRSLHEFLLPGHVDIEVLGREGHPLRSAQAPLASYASKKGGMKEARFFRRLGLDLPPDASILLRYHGPGKCPRFERDS